MPDSDLREQYAAESAVHQRFSFFGVDEYFSNLCPECCDVY